MPQTEGVLDRLTAAAKPDEAWPLLVLAALEGPSTLEAQLEGHPEEVAGRVHHTWGELSRACHHHPYELAPSVGELQALLASVSEFQELVAATAS